MTGAVAAACKGIVFGAPGGDLGGGDGAGCENGRGTGLDRGFRGDNGNGQRRCDDRWGWRCGDNCRDNGGRRGDSDGDGSFHCGCYRNGDRDRGRRGWNFCNRRGYDRGSDWNGSDRNGSGDGLCTRDNQSWFVLGSQFFAHGCIGNRGSAWRVCLGGGRGGRGCDFCGCWCVGCGSKFFRGADGRLRGSVHAGAAEIFRRHDGLRSCFEQRGERWRRRLLNGGNGRAGCQQDGFAAGGRGSFCHRCVIA